MKVFSRSRTLLAGALLISMFGSNQPALSQSTDYLVVRFVEVDVHRRLDSRRKPTPELYAKVNFPGYNWVRSSGEVVGSNIYPGWVFSRNVRASNSHTIGIEVWDRDGGRGQRDDRGLGTTINNINIENCNYGVGETKVGYSGQRVDGMCVIRHRLHGSHLTADVIVEAY